MISIQLNTFPQTTAPLDKTATQCYIGVSMTGGRDGGGTGDFPIKRYNYVKQQIKRRLMPI